MKRKIFIGSIGIIFLLVLVSFTSIVNAQIIKSSNLPRDNDLIEKIRRGFLAGSPPWLNFLMYLFSILLSIIIWWP